MAYLILIKKRLALTSLKFCIVFNSNKDDQPCYHLNLSVFKCLSGLAPPSMCNYFTLVSDSHKLNTRSSTLGKIRPMKPSLEYGRCSFQYREALLGTTCTVQSFILCHETLVTSNQGFDLCNNLILSNLHIVLVQFCLIIKMCAILFHLC